jgi:hypothetical protein
MQRAYDMVQELWNDAEVGPKVRRTANKKFGVPIVDDQLEPVIAPLRAQNEALQKRLDELAAEREADRKQREDDAKKQQEQTFQATFDAVVKKYGLTDETRDKVIARMKETGNYTDPAAAAAYILSEMPAPVSPGPTVGPQYVNFAQNDAASDRLKSLWRDPEKYFDAECAKALNPSTARDYYAEVMGEPLARINFGY